MVRASTYVTFITIAALLSACGGGGDSGSTGVVPVAATPSPTATPTPAAASCSLRDRQDWAASQLREWYLFPETLPATISPAAFTTVSDYIDALTATARAQRKDRYFTYLTSIASEDSYYASGGAPVTGSVCLMTPIPDGFTSQKASRARRRPMPGSTAAQKS